MGIEMLPQEFADKMKHLLGEEYEEFLRSYEQPRNFGLRVNVNKISVEEFQRIAPFHLTPIPWVPNGFYYEEQDAPARHPFYYAGLYYLQEPSAMTPASVLKVNPGERVLDLCAAPGGKATELGARLHGQGVLVANDISASRAKALLKNLEVFGISNVFVTNEVPAKLSGQFEEFFDKILVDAPCSGEGMFRKDPAVARAWDPEKPIACAKQQREIISRAAQMLAPGGELLYSTCTFSPEENEEVIQYLLNTREDMELEEISGYEGFSKGLAGFEKCVRIWPHRMNGEGHFVALLKKRGSKAGDDNLPPAKKEGQEEAEDRGRKKAGFRKKDCGAGKKAENRTENGAGCVQKQDRGALEEFFFQISREMDWAAVEVRKGQAYDVPQALGQRKGLVFLRNGLYLGEIRKDRLEPSQSLAMALKKEEFAQTVDFDWRDERVLRYLKGETLEVEDLTGRERKGWQLVCVNGYPLGWGKLSFGTLKNKYHAGWRMKY